MNTRRLTKKYKYKNRNKKTRRNRKSRRRVLKGGLPSVSSVSRASSRSSGVRRGVIVNRTSGSSSSFRPSSGSVRPDIRFAGIYKPKFNFECFYKKLMNTPNHELHSTLQDNKDMYIKNTTFQTFQPKGAYLNMTGLKFVNYLHGKYKNADKQTKTKIRSIISLFDQCNMSQGVRSTDLHSIEVQVHPTYFACYKILFDELCNKLFPNGNGESYPISTSATTLKVPPTIKEE